MTDTERERLVGVMGEAMRPWRFGTITSRNGMRTFNVDLEKLEAAIAAAEREGWRFLPPVDGR